MAEMKACTSCKKAKPIEDFGRHKLCSGGINSMCKACNREKSQAWRKQNPDREKSSAKAYRAANKAKVKAVKAAYYAANASKVKASVAAWRKSNPEKAKEYGDRWIADNKEKVRANLAAWRAANPDQSRAQVHNYRAKKRAAGGVLSKGLSQRLFLLQKGRCPCCGERLGDDYHMDHIVPIALGGANVDGNIQLLRQRCNNQKHAKHPVEFMQQRGFLL